MFNRARNNQIVDEAADWAVHIDSGNMLASEKEALADWLRESPRHVEELLIAVSIFAELEVIDPERRLSIDDILSNAAGNVVTLGNNPDPVNAHTPMKPRHEVQPRGVAATVACAVLMLTFLYFGFSTIPKERDGSTNEIYATALGEQRSILLDDGSIVHVNTQTEIQVEYTAAERRIILLRGEAMFDVKKDVHRPFRVVASNAIAEAVGTMFNVRHRGDGVSVVVLEGRVAVETEDQSLNGTDAGQSMAPPASVDNGRVLLTSGERVDISSFKGEPVVVAQADITATKSWRLRELVFESEALGDIVSEFNRYNKVQIIVSDDIIARSEFSGLFRADDPWSFVAFLELTADITVDSTRDQIHLRSRPGWGASEPGNL